MTAAMPAPLDTAGSGRLQSKVAIVTGAAGAGIGQAVARRYAAEGAKVVVTDAHASRPAEVAKDIEATSGAETLGMTVDVRDAGQIAEMVSAALDRWGRVDVLHNNVGINKLAPIWEMDDETWDFVNDICLKAAFRTMRAVLPAMMEQGSGSIVNMASVAGYIGSTQGEAAYCAAKAGVMGLTRAAAAELGPKGVRVNAIAPGLIWNPFLERIYPPGELQKLVEPAALGRAGQPEEVAALSLFLASDESRYITGEVHTISGGMYYKA
ncbi:SDR family NAD(P)-dependent oxidoreductase [Pseudonocardia sp. WMMC193]|uniref:SDR family NAD(P)-dependent oxidoreductase n=1 Tax=Pseudonocardia sp. WMMC193 TaxID=2911965 RepID=UPI001F365F2C|nr:SDR family NAD(P)-dependent oxidoreductase [Pseudonocardia sp. WMMC193]MCF7550797.1 SDR family oxidoreductase [Pseudonocardia sp. WMMC193]